MASRSITTAALAPRPPAKAGPPGPPQPKVAYDRRRPELTALHQAVAEGWPQLRELVREQVQAPLPKFVERGFEAYLSCGQLAAGLTRCRCRDCGSEYVVVSAAGPPPSLQVFARVRVPNPGGQAVARGGLAGVRLAPRTEVRGLRVKKSASRTPRTNGRSFCVRRCPAAAVSVPVTSWTQQFVGHCPCSRLIRHVCDALH
jgi:hypothetical protein